MRILRAREIIRDARRIYKIRLLCAILAAED
jgi:hypothetical protein